MRLVAIPMSWARRAPARPARAQPDRGHSLSQPLGDPPIAADQPRHLPSEQAVTADLTSLPDAVRKIVVAAAIDGPATFAQAGAIEITVARGTSARAVAQATLDAATTERTLLLAGVYRRGPGWRVRAVGQGYDHQLASLARGFGVDIVG